ncbi:lanthionine synthetase C family protein [uncultured Kordia sp.]|uniref:lanthionine synthetase C family protein n=1 Tax=uncultured Kordia sp. TaxID=507699 RepID=UPI00260DF4CE|nr:lanthionine synthetase C family protein [uncultured Kordia sp.]
MNVPFFESELKKIHTIIKESLEAEQPIGVLNGLAGVSLFQFHYAKYLKDKNHKNLGPEILNRCIDQINNGFNNYTFCNGIAGFGWLLDHLNIEGIVENDNSFLKAFDSDIYSFMQYSFEINFYDYMHGAIGSAYYFLNRYRDSETESDKERYAKVLREFIVLLLSTAEEEGETLKWKSTNNNFDEATYDLGLAHGTASIISILTKLNAYDDFKPSTDDMLRKAINYLLSVRNGQEETFSIFPNTIFNADKIIRKSRLGWCYGDLGIGIALYNAGKQLNDNTLKQTSIDILMHAAKRKTPEETWVKDPFVCHGTFGNAQIFHRIYKETNIDVFKEAFEFWLQIGIDVMSPLSESEKTTNEWAQDYNASIQDNFSIVNGVAGIGLVMLDCLTNLNSNWDECLMIS